MFNFFIRLYLPICAAVLLGAFLSFLINRPRIKNRFQRPLNQEIPAYLGKFLFFVGVPISVINFLRKADLSGSIWLSPVVAWIAMILGIVCAGLWIWPKRHQWKRRSQGSFILAAMIGNTGYIGFPVNLLLPQLGPDYFGWALFYDILGTFFGAYGLGVILGSRFGSKQNFEDDLKNFEEEGSQILGVKSAGEIAKELLQNPTLFAFLMGLLLRPVLFPKLLSIILNGFAWTMVMLSLVLMGMRLQQLTSWKNIKPAAAAVAIKMIVVPLVIGMALTSLNFEGPARLALVLQAGMPSAFATLVLAENYYLDRNLAVTTVGLSSVVLLVTLPLWLWGFGTW